MSSGPQKDSNNSPAAASSPHGLGPPPSRPLTKKRPHRRSPQACDECRLRKRACDAAEPCRPCQRSGLKCTYQFRRPVPPPTLRIRNLQDHLSLARKWIQHVKDHAPNVPGLDLDECLRTLDFTQPTSNDASSPATTAPTPAKSPASAVSTPAQAGSEHTPSSMLSISRHNPGNMLAGCDRAATMHSGETCFYGAFSDISFALRTIELFRQVSASDDHNELERFHQIYAKPVDVKSGTMERNVPSLGDHLKLEDSAFDTPHLMFCFIDPKTLRSMSYQSTASLEFIPHLHLALAFQHLTDCRKHQTQTCQSLRDEAYAQFQKGMVSLLPVYQDSLLALQAHLCAINTLLLMGRMTAAHSFTSSAASMALRMGIFDQRKMANGVRRTQITQAMATLLALDMLLSLIFDITACLPRDVAEETQLVALAQDAESEGDLRTAAMLRQACLLLVPISIRDRSRRAATSTTDGESDAVMEDIRLLETAHARFRRWKREVSSLLTSLGPANEDRIITKDLEMVYNFCQIIVFRSHLHHLRSVAVGGSMSKAQSYHALACLKIATTTIGHVDRPTDIAKLRNLTDSWLGVYTIFSAVMCLVFLIAAHPGTARPSVAWQRAHKGILILAACSCGNNMAAACLELVKIVTTELSHTVYFDYDEIEATVRRVCDGEESKDSPAGTSPSMSANGSNAFMDIPADRMLFQADTLRAEFDFRDILHLSDSE